MTRVRRPALHAWQIATAAGLVPVVAVHACLAMSSALGTIDPTLPYVDGGVSVSKACRQVPSIYLFRAMILPSAALLALTWWICARWLGARGLARPRGQRWVLGLGLSASLLLVLYATFLGTKGDVYELLRRYGIYVFFGGTSIAELIVTALLTRARPPSLEPRVLRTMQVICGFMLAAGPANVVADKIVEGDVAANALEWWFGLGMLGYPLLLARVWAREGLRLELSSSGDGSNS